MADAAETPTDKLQSPIPGKRHVVLLLNGSFNPIHINHVRMLELVRDFIGRESGTASDWQVLGAYLNVTNDRNLCRKLEPKEFCPAKHRVAMARLSVKDSDWIMVDSWQAAQKDRNPGATVSKLHLKRVLSLQVPDCHIVSITGPDVLPKVCLACLR